MRPALLLPLLLAACGASAPAPPPRPYANPGPFCTRTLGTPECFATPYMLPDHPAPLGDTPVRTPPPAPNLLERIAHDWHQDE
jgi:hypothetical protein